MTEWFIRLVGAPAWFIEAALATQLITALALLAVALQAWRLQRLSERKGKFRILTGATLLLALGFVLRATVDIALSAQIVELHEAGIASLRPALIGETAVFSAVALYRFLILTGLFLLYTLHNPVGRRHAVLSAFLLGLTTYASLGEYYIFHLAAFVLAGLVVYNFWRAYGQTRHPITILLIASFTVIALGQLLLIFKGMEAFFLLGTVIHALGYVGLVSTLLLSKKNGKVPLKT